MWGKKKNLGFSFLFFFLSMATVDDLTCGIAPTLFSWALSTYVSRYYALHMLRSFVCYSGNVLRGLLVKPLVRLMDNKETQPLRPWLSISMVLLAMHLGESRVLYGASLAWLPDTLWRVNICDFNIRLCSFMHTHGLQSSTLPDNYCAGFFSANQSRGQYIVYLQVPFPWQLCG